jgi:hypothetical protein
VEFRVEGGKYLVYYLAKLYRLRQKHTSNTISLGINALQPGLKTIVAFAEGGKNQPYFYL